MKHFYRHVFRYAPLLLWLATGPAFGQVVLPAGVGGGDGDSNNNFPFNCDGFTASMRYQQVYLGSEVGTGEIDEIRFRQDSRFGTGFGPATLPSVTIQLSSTTTADPTGFPVGMSFVFADNIGPDVTTVFSGDLVLASASSASVPRPFDIVIPLAPRFFFDASSGANLLLDVILPACVETTVMDSQTVVDDGVARATSLDATATEANNIDTLGLVTQLFFVIFADGFESGDVFSWSAAVP